MDKNLLKNLLNNYQPADTDEINYKQQMLSLLEQRSDCFERDCYQPGHFTGSAWLLDDTEQQVLLMHHSKLDRWFQPGGHCDGDADVLRVALKEAYEETGIDGIQVVSEEIFDLDVHIFPKRSDCPEHKHFDVRFLLKAPKGAVFVQNHESKALAWFKLDEPKKFPNQERSQMRMVDKLLASRKLALV